MPAVLQAAAEQGPIATFGNTCRLPGTDYHRWMLTQNPAATALSYFTPVTTVEAHFPASTATGSTTDKEAAATPAPSGESTQLPVEVCCHQH